MARIRSLECGDKGLLLGPIKPHAQGWKRAGTKRPAQVERIEIREIPGEMVAGNTNWGAENAKLDL
jgi:hypothetical protein